MSASTASSNNTFQVTSVIQNLEIPNHALVQSPRIVLRPLNQNQQSGLLFQNQTGYSNPSQNKINTRYDMFIANEQRSTVSMSQEEQEMVLRGSIPEWKDENA